MWYSNYLRDPVIHETLKGLAFGTQRYEPKVVFVNGEFYGILNARDRKDKFYIENAFELEDIDIDLLKRKAVIDSGSNKSYLKMLESWKEQDHNSLEFYEQVEQQIDLESFLDYYATSIFFARTDWPGNNIAYWRVVENISGINDPKDGRWRWLLYDADESLRTEHPTLLYALGQYDKPRDYQPWASFVFGTLLKNKKIKHRFIIRSSDLLNSYLLSERGIEFIRKKEKVIEREMPKHIARWKAPKSMEYWRRKVNEMVDFAEKRPAIQREHLQEFFDLGDLYTLRLRVLVEGEDGRTEPASKAAMIKLNTLTLGVSDDELEKPVAASARATNMEKYLSFPWQGEYFAGMPIKLSVEPRPGYRFSHWVGRDIPEDQKYDPNIELTPGADTLITAVMTRSER